MFVSVIFVRGILAELSDQGRVPAEILAGLGLPDDALPDLRTRVACGDLERIMVRAVQMSGDPGLGLSMGMRAPESMLQILGYLLLSCRTLREAFGALSRYAVLTVDGADWGLSETGERAHFTFRCPLPPGVGQRFAAEFVFAMALRIAGHFVPDFKDGLEQVRFEHEAPAYAERYARVFSCPVQFAEPVNGISFPRRFLDVPQFHADALTNWALRDTAERVLGQLDRPHTVADRVRSILRSEAVLASIEVEKLARSVGLTRRSLRRRLAAEGTSLTSLVDEARCRLACEELRREESIRAISERVGYSEPSAFHRAFRRWTGQTPSEYVRGA